MRDVANSATAIKTRTPTRSDHGARLKNSHHTTINSPPTSPPITPRPTAPGITTALVGMSRTEHVVENLGLALVSPLDRQQYLQYFRTTV